MAELMKEGKNGLGDEVWEMEHSCKDFRETRKLTLPHYTVRVQR